MVIFTNIINLYDNILINKYQALITCNRLTPLQFSWHKGLLSDGAQPIIVSKVNRIRRRAPYNLVDKLFDQHRRLVQYPNGPFPIFSPSTQRRSLSSLSLSIEFATLGMLSVT